MKTGWKTKKLVDFATLQRGFDLPRQDRSSGDVPLVTSSGISDTVSKSAVDGPGVATGRSGSIGNVFFIEEDFWPLNTVLYVKDFHGNDPRFVFHLLKNFDLKRFATGTGVPTLNRNCVHDELVNVPPLAEQQRIVRLLDEAFGGLATAKANAEKNLQNARALFESHLQSVFTQRGPGWVDTALGDVCGFVRGPFGGSLKKSIFVADGYSVYEQQHAIYDQFDDVRYFIDDAKFKEMKRFELLPDDLIMSCSGTMGRVAIVPKGIKRGIINQALLKLTPSPKIMNIFLKSWMESEAFQDALKEYSGGAAIQNVASVKILKEIKVPLPSMSDQKRVVEELDALSDETQRLARLYERKIVALVALKKSLLHQAFSGEL